MEMARTSSAGKHRHYVTHSLHSPRRYRDAVVLGTGNGLSLRSSQYRKWYNDSTGRMGQPDDSIHGTGSGTGMYAVLRKSGMQHLELNLRGVYIYSDRVFCYSIGTQDFSE